jgi:hypothetical protein
MSSTAHDNILLLKDLYVQKILHVRRKIVPDPAGFAASGIAQKKPT